MLTHLLVVEDETAVQEMLSFTLNRAGFDVALADSAQSLFASVAHRVPDLILMDWMLSDVSGIELVRRLKKEPLSAEIPIIMLTARVQEDDKVHGLNAGADDYVTKPFSPKELVARIHALLRRSTGQSDDGVLRVGRLSLDRRSHRVLVEDKPVSLGPIEFKLLRFFMSHRERVYSRSQLLDQVWGQSTYVEERTVDVHVLRLRKVLSPFDLDGLIQTVRGAGYRFSKQT
ncbi:MAG: phosphate regulon transcriptional regulator PhoB [Gammaproteobacteria bacterium]|nr:phosphate regulon transcriptional regulator PhoB [Gammaproteobacteria bacterium]